MANPQPSRKSCWYKFYQFREDAAEPCDARSAILVVATLIATVTFQAVVNPPGGVWQDNNNGHMAGRSIYAFERGRAYILFLLFNTIAFSTSILVIMCLTYKFPFYEWIYFATGLMMLTYDSALFAITPHYFKKNIGFRCAGVIVTLVPFVVRIIIRRHKKDG